MHIKVSAPDLPVHNIDTGKDYATIQEAIDASETSDGHTIVVDDGMYNENVTINKSVRLHGASQNTTIIDGNGADNVVSLTASGAEIAGFTMRNGSNGISLQFVENVNVTDNKVLNCSYGIFIHECSKCKTEKNTAISTSQAGIYLSKSVRTLIINNTIADTIHGVWLLDYSTNNTISNNFVSNNPQGIVASYNCNNNTIIGNTVTSSSFNLGGDIVMEGAYNNTIYHNNLLGVKQAWIYEGSLNFWDDGTEGNFWKDYLGSDLDEDGIGAPYTIDENNTDNHPLMGNFTDFNVAWEEESHHVYIISNSTISDFAFKVTYEPEIRKRISFNVTGEDGTVGFCRVMVPTVLVNYSYYVMVQGEEVDVKVLDISNDTHAYLYFTYTSTTKHVVIVPEFLSALILPFFMILAIFAAVFQRKTITVGRKTRGYTLVIRGKATCQNLKKLTVLLRHNVYIHDWKRNFYTHTKQKLTEKGVV